MEGDNSSFISRYASSDPDKDKCIYYNTTNNKFLIDAYEGIPQNLLLNFIAWLVSNFNFRVLYGNETRNRLTQYLGHLYSCINSILTTSSFP